MRRLLAAAAAALALAVGLLVAPGPAGASTPFQPAPVLRRPAPAHYLPGTACRLFPPDSVWHARVDRLPVATQSAAWLSHMSASSRSLHPDFGGPYGIPITYVSPLHPRVSVRFDYADESDPGPYPLGPGTRIEGGATSTGDRHTIVVDALSCRLYETWSTYPTSTGWTAGSGAIWSLRSDALRPAGWTSADAAGLAILPGLLRYDEVSAGVVDHAIRFTTNTTSKAYLWPARHQAGSTTDTSYPPMGARFRLKSSYDISHFRADTQVVLRAMQRYGLILADNGSPWFFQGATDARWPDALVADLKQVPAAQFEAVDESSLMVSSGSGAARPQP